MPLVSAIVPIIGNYCCNLDYFNYQSQIRHCCYITITITASATIVAITLLNFQNYLVPFGPMNIGFNYILSCSPGYSLSRIDSIIIDIAVQMDFTHWNIGLPQLCRIIVVEERWIRHLHSWLDLDLARILLVFQVLLIAEVLDLLDYQNWRDLHQILGFKHSKQLHFQVHRFHHHYWKNQVHFYFR